VFFSLKFQKIHVWFDTMLLWKKCLSINMWMPAHICWYIYYIPLSNYKSFFHCVDQIDERNPFPYQIYLSQDRCHPIICAPQLPDIIWLRANLWFSHSIDKQMMYVFYVLIYSIVSLDHKFIDLFNKILLCKKCSIPVHSWLFLRLVPIMISLIAGWF
jgi:hypothetical protein